MDVVLAVAGLENISRVNLRITYWFTTVNISVADPDHFDTDPDPAFGSESSLLYESDFSL